MLLDNQLVRTIKIRFVTALLFLILSSCATNPTTSSTPSQISASTGTSPIATTTSSESSEPVPAHISAKIDSSQTGIASFYGHNDGFNGRRMANGRIFNANNPHLAAHPTLPLGSKLKVTNDKTGKTLYVEVCDRMGQVDGRILDLSYAASKYFKMRKSGLTNVTITVVSNSEYKKHLTTPSTHKHKKHHPKHKRHSQKHKQ